MSIFTPPEIFSRYSKFSLGIVSKRTALKIGYVLGFREEFKV